MKVELLMADVRPIHAAHSIQELTLALEFQSALSQKALQNLYDHRSEFSDQLPGDQIFRGHLLPVGQGLQIQGFPAAQALVATGSGGDQMPIVAVQFIRMQPSGVLDTRLTAQQNSVAFTCMAYSRWVEVWNIGRGLFSRVVPMIMESPVIIFGMNYVDKYLISGNPEEFNPLDLFRDNGSHIPSIILDKPLFHIHQGYFSALHSGGKALVNVNVDVQDDAVAGRVVTVTTYLRAFADPPEESAERLFTDGRDGVADVKMEELHEKAKSILADLLSDKMVEKINLKAP